MAEYSVDQTECAWAVPWAGNLADQKVSRRAALKVDSTVAKRGSQKAARLAGDWAGR